MFSALVLLFNNEFGGKPYPSETVYFLTCGGSTIFELRCGNGLQL